MNELTTVNGEAGIVPPGRHGQPAEMNLWRIVVDLECPWRGEPDPLGIPTHQYRQHAIYTVLAGEDVYPDAKAVARAMYPSYRVVRIRCVEWLAVGDVAPYPNGIAFETSKVRLEAIDDDDA